MQKMPSRQHFLAISPIVLFKYVVSVEFVFVWQLPSRLFTSLFVWVNSFGDVVDRQQIINIPHCTALYNAIVTSQQITNYHCFTWKHTVYCRRAEQRVWWPPPAWSLICPTHQLLAFSWWPMETEHSSNSESGTEEQRASVGERTVKEQDIQKFLLKAPCGQQEVHYHSEVSQDIT